MGSKKDFDSFVEQQREDPEFAELLDEEERRLRGDDDPPAGVREPQPTPPSSGPTAVEYCYMGHPDCYDQHTAERLADEADWAEERRRDLEEGWEYGH